MSSLEISSRLSLCKEVDEGWLHYDYLSGETVLISDFSHLVIELLSSKTARNVEELCALLCHECGDLEPSVVNSELRRTLGSLVKIGLIKSL